MTPRPRLGLLLAIALIAATAITSLAAQGAGFDRTDGRSGAIAIAYAPDGTKLLTGSTGSALVWDAANGALLRTLDAGTGSRLVVAVAFSPDGAHVLTSGDDNNQTLKLWDLSTGHMVRAMAGHTDAIDAVAFSPNGKLLASASGDKTVKLWDAASGRLTRTWTATGSIYGIAFAPNGKFVLAGCEQGMTLWDVAGGSTVQTFADKSAFLSVAFSPDGTRVLSGNAISGFLPNQDRPYFPYNVQESHNLNLWNAETGQLVRTWQGVQKQPFPTAGSTPAAFSPDGARVMLADTAVRLWNVTTGQPVNTFGQTGRGYYAAAFSPDGKFVATNDGGTMQVWDAATGQIKLDFK